MPGKANPPVPPKKPPTPPPPGQAPVAENDRWWTDEDTLQSLGYSANLLANDSDPNKRDVLTVTEINGDGASVNSTILITSDGQRAANLTVLDDGSVNLSVPPSSFDELAVGEHDIISFTYRISDGIFSDTATTTITINGVNDTPVAVDDSATTVEDTVLNVAAAGVLTNDTDVDETDELTVSVFDATSAQGAAVTVNADGSFSYDPTSAPALQALAAGDSVVDTFTYTVSDDHEATDTATVSITVNGLNDDPRITSSSNISINENTTAVVTLTATDPEDDTLTYAITGGADDESFQIINGDQLVFKVAPNYENPADADGDNVYNVEVTVHDGNGGSNTQTISTAVTDVNEYIDAFVANYAVGVSTALNELLINNGGTLISDFAVGESRSSTDVALGDLNGDDYLDVFVTNFGSTPNQILFYDTDENALVATVLPAGAANSADVALGDVDNDGDLDVVVVNEDVYKSNELLINEGEGTFVSQYLPTSSGLQSQGVALGDLDGDGYVDAIIANWHQYGGGSPLPNDVLMNQGDGTFVVTQHVSGSGRFSSDVAIGDLDGDGDLDAIVTNAYSSNEILINQGVEQEGTLGTFIAYDLPTNSGYNSSSVALGDLDGDGDFDAIVANYNEFNTVLINQGGLQDGAEGVFEVKDLLAAEVRKSRDVALADFDGDGDLDAIVSNDQQANQILINNGLTQEGNWNFSVEQLDTPGTTELRGFGVAVGDLDGDGDISAVDAYGLPNINLDDLLPSIYVDIEAAEPLAAATLDASAAALPESSEPTSDTSLSPDLADDLVLEMDGSEIDLDGLLGDSSTNTEATESNANETIASSGALDQSMDVGPSTSASIGDAIDAVFQAQDAGNEASVAA